jgi:hypothetical protein
MYVDILERAQYDAEMPMAVARLQAAEQFVMRQCFNYGDRNDI